MTDHEPVPQQVDNRLGTTDRELATWLEAHPEDADVAEAAELIRGTVAAWREGRLTTDETLEALYGNEYANEGKLSEVALSMLDQSGMWFSYEAGASVDDDMAAQQRAARTFGIFVEPF